MNTGGISGQAKVSNEKRRRIFNSIRHNNDIVILTETKLKKNEMNTYKQDWNSGLLASCTSEQRAQAGVAILFRRGLAVDIINHGQDSNGRVVWALVEIYAKKFSSLEYMHLPRVTTQNFSLKTFFQSWGKSSTSTLRGLGTPNSVCNRRQRGRKAPGAG